MRVPLLIFVWALIVLTGCSGTAEKNSQKTPGTLQLTAPGERLVYQRDAGTALIPVAGRTSLPAAELEARLIPVNTNGSSAKPYWQRIGRAQVDGTFAHRLKAPEGWYQLEVRARTPSHQATATVARVGVGEVFIVVGHSVAHGGRTNLSGATDDRVNTIAWATNSAARREYEATANPAFLPPPSGTLFADDVVPAPFGHGTYFWAQFGEHVVKSQRVPVLVLNAAFGGTSLEHWAKSARGEHFEHSFVKSPLRMPYINLHHALRRYASETGVRAILADQGQNDWSEKDGQKVFTNYRTWIEQARVDANFPGLAIVVNRATPPGQRKTIREAQERVIQQVPQCFQGPDYDTLAREDRYDGVHLSEAGMKRAAKLWADALTPEFFRDAVPYSPR